MKTLPWIIICILICLILFYHYTYNSNHTPRPLEAEIEHYYLKGQIAQWMSNEGLEVKNVSLFYGNDSSKIMSLYDIVDKPTLVYCISSKMCSSCTQFGLEKMKEYFGKLENNPNILFVVSDLTPREKRALYHNQCYSYAQDSETFDLPIESSAIPFFFIIDTDRKVKMLFYPDSTNPIYTEKYLEVVSRRIMKNSKLIQAQE